MPTIARPAPPPIRALLLLATLASASAASARAQAAPAGLQRRMNAFAAALREMEPMATIAGFFPRRGDWEFVESPDRVAPGATVMRQRFPPASTLAAISEGSPICDSFGGATGDVGPGEGTLVFQAMTSKRRWRYVGRGRFVPPFGDADWPVYVEWRREDGAWVVSRIGAQYYYFPRAIGRPVEPGMTRDTTEGRGLPRERRFATGRHWYREGAPIRLEGSGFYLKYGLPRVIDDSLLVRFGSIGVVPVFVEPATHRQRPEVIYVLTGPGEYQPYQTFGNSVCRSD